MVLRSSLLLALGLNALAQNCQQSAEPSYLLHTLADLAAHSALSPQAFSSLLPCTRATVALSPLLEGIQGNLSLEQRKTLIQYFRPNSPLHSEDLDAISKSSLSGELIDEMLRPLKYGDLTIDNHGRVDPAILSRLKSKGVSDDILKNLSVLTASEQPSISPSHARGRIIDNPPNFAVTGEDPMAKTLQNSGSSSATPEKTEATPADKRSLGVFKIGGDVSQPIPIYKIEPEYSDAARGACHEGTVLLQVIIDDHGLTRDIRVTRPLGLGLDEKAIEAVAKWRFRPAMREGHPVAVLANIEMNFRLLSCTPRANTTQQASNSAATTTQEVPATPISGRKFSSSAFLTGVQIVEVHWNNSSFGGAVGYGRGNLVETAGRQGFEFAFSCSHPFLPSEGEGLYPARWKKEDTRLIIQTTEIGNANKHSNCELKISRMPFTYEMRNTTLYTAPLH